MVSEVYNHGKSICCSQFSSFAQEPEMNFVLYPVPLLRISVQKIRPGLDTSPGRGVQDYSFYGSITPTCCSNWQSLAS
jgi:hypothetical protein